MRMQRCAISPAVMQPDLRLVVMVLIGVLPLATSERWHVVQGSCSRCRGGGAAASSRLPSSGVRRAVAVDMRPGVGVRVRHIALQQRVQYSHNAGADLGGISLEVVVPVQTRLHEHEQCPSASSTALLTL